MLFFFKFIHLVHTTLFDMVR